MKRRELLYTLGVGSIGAVSTTALAATGTASTISPAPDAKPEPNNKVAETVPETPYFNMMGSAFDVPFI